MKSGAISRCATIGSMELSSGASPKLSAAWRMRSSSATSLALLTGYTCENKMLVQRKLAETIILKAVAASLLPLLETFRAPPLAIEDQRHPTIVTGQPADLRE